jgi:hypothetical protein
VGLVAKLLGPPENVDTCPCLPGQVHRWMIFQNQRFRVYLHHSSSDLLFDLSPYPEWLLDRSYEIVRE